MEFSLSDENKMIQETVRNWVNRECSRNQVLKWDDEGGIPLDKFRELADLGFCGLKVPGDFGGQGSGIFNTCLVLEELAAISPPLAIQFASCAVLGGALMDLLGTKEQQKEFFPACVDGSLLISLAVGDPDDPFWPGPDAPRYIQSGDHYILNGIWNYVLLADRSGLFIVAAFNDNKDSREWSLFLVKSGKGVLVEPIEALGLRGASICRLKLDEIKIPADDALGGAEKIGNGPLLWELLSGLLSLQNAFIAVGLARGAFDYALEYAKQRIQFKQPIGRFPAMREKLTEIEIETNAARLLALESAWLYDQGKPFARKAYMAQSLASRTARQACLDCLQILGGYGYTLEYDAQRMLRDSLGLIAMSEKRESLDARLGEGLGL
jgi:alkylation response protein AidB-like acyl-CoA dehydrogenase